MHLSHSQKKIAADVGAGGGHPDEVCAGNDVFEVYMAQNVFDDIADISRSDPHRGRGGILLGRVLTNQGASLILIEGYIVAEYTKEHGKSVLFTADSWQQINSDRKRDFPHRQIVGWFHIQPDAGSALSFDDKFIQHNCAGLLWQIAYIIDPLNCTKELFCLVGEKIVSSEFKIAADPYGQKPSVLDCLGCINKSQFQETAHANRRSVLFITVLVLLLLVSNVYYWYNARMLSGQVGRLQQYASQLENSNQVLAERVNNNQYWHYVVHKEQTLADISNIFYGSEDYVNDIATLNNIADIYELQVGQEVLIPIININRHELNE